MEKIEMIAKWRVFAMLNYIKHNLDDTSRNDMMDIIKKYIAFTQDITDASVLVCKADQFPEEYLSMYDDGTLPLEIKK